MLSAQRVYSVMVAVMAGKARDDERGAAMVEYGLLVAFIAVIALVGVKALGVNINTLFGGIKF